jgi:hypothetical protein
MYGGTSTTTGGNTLDLIRTAKLSLELQSYYDSTTVAEYIVVIASCSKYLLVIPVSASSFCSFLHPEVAAPVLKCSCIRLPRVFRCVPMYRYGCTCTAVSDTAVLNLVR